MKLTLVCLLFYLFRLGLAEICGKDEVYALDPFTQKTTCLEPYLEKSVVVVAEKDCLPCKAFLQRVQRDKQESNSYEVRTLWIEADPRNCLELALKVQPFAKSHCISRKEVEKKWGVRSTPQAFWKMNGQKNERHQGSVDEKKPLPWRIIKP